MTKSAKSWPAYAGLFFVSAAILHLEILQTRIFSVMLWHHVTYLVVTFTLLGFAAAGALVAVRPSMLRGDLSRKLALYSFLFGITTVAAFALLSMIRLDTVNLLKNRIQYFILFVYYVYLIVPYFFGGLVVVLVLSGMAKDVNRLYFVNLAGSGAGCLFFLPVIGWAGGAGSILIVTAVASLGALCFALAAERRAVSLASGALLLAASLGALPLADDLIHIRAAPSKAMSVHAEKMDGVVEHSMWDPLCRVDVLADPDSGTRSIYQDGDAPTTIMEWEEGAVPRMGHYSLGYGLLYPNNPKILVIGVGGGLDIRQGLTFKASSITGAEINPTIARLMREEYGEFTGHLYDMEGVDVHVAEGRSFLRRSEEIYDLIQMTGTDTYSALASGSFVLSESYLYTLEAFDDYLEHLSDDGVIAVLRFRFYPPRECLRLVSIGASAMKNSGIAEPSRHILVISYKRPPYTYEEQTLQLYYAVMLFKKTPFTTQQIKMYRNLCTKKKEFRYTLSYAPGGEGEQEFRDLLAAVDRGEEDGFLAEYPYDVGTVSDDKPFFFAYHKWKTLFDRVTSPNYQGFIGEDPVGLYILLSVLLEATALVALLVILPLLVFKRRGLKVPSSGRIIFYFFALGISYLFIEIASMQKFVLFLGHPTYSLSIVLFSFLLFSGFGSFFGQRFEKTPLRGIGLAVVFIAVLLVLYHFILPVVFEYGLKFSTPLRMVISVILLAPLGFFMGMPFPLGIRVVDQRSPDLIPWAFGINGGASVVSSVVSIVLAMGGGFSVVFLVAGLLYLAGWLFFLKVAPAGA